MTNDEARALIESGRKYDKDMHSTAPKCECNGAAGCEDWCPCAPWNDAYYKADMWFEANHGALLDGYAGALDRIAMLEQHITEANANAPHALIDALEALTKRSVQLENTQRNLERMTVDRDSARKALEVAQKQLGKFMSIAPITPDRLREIVAAIQTLRIEAQRASAPHRLEPADMLTDLVAGVSLLSAEVVRLTTESVERGARIRDMAERLGHMNPVVEAAKGWQTCTSKGLGSSKEQALSDAVRAYKSIYQGKSDKPQKDQDQ
jgi:hypothetical protein